MSASRDFLLNQIARLEAELNADPRSIELGRLKAALEAYDRIGTAMTVGVTAPVTSKPSLNHMPYSKAGKVKQVVLDMLRERGPTHRSAILEQLSELGLMGHEADPIKSLSFYLSSWRDAVAPSQQGSGIWELLRR